MRLYKDGKYTGKEILSEAEHAKKQSSSNISCGGCLFWIVFITVVSTCCVVCFPNEDGDDALTGVPYIDLHVV
jgi:hypothetical protein